MPRICPWWLTYSFDNPIRKCFHNPHKMLVPYIQKGMRVADIGCGMGYFTSAIAELVGPTGKVQAVDLQEEQLQRVKKRCKDAGVIDRVKFITARPDSLCLDGEIDFLLAFWMVHEVPNHDSFFAEIAQHLKPSGVMLLVEPKMHVSASNFNETVARARAQGFIDSPAEKVALSRSVLFKRK